MPKNKTWKNCFFSIIRIKLATKNRIAHIRWRMQRIKTICIIFTIQNCLSQAFQERVGIKRSSFLSRYSPYISRLCRNSRGCHAIPWLFLHIVKASRRPFRNSVIPVNASPFIASGKRFRPQTAAIRQICGLCALWWRAVFAMRRSHLPQCMAATVMRQFIILPEYSSHLE